MVRKVLKPCRLPGRYLLPQSSDLKMVTVFSSKTLVSSYKFAPQMKNVDKLNVNSGQINRNKIALL